MKVGCTVQRLSAPFFGPHRCDTRCPPQSIEKVTALRADRGLARMSFARSYARFPRSWIWRISNSSTARCKWRWGSP
jgi:hypothetical protein